MSGEQESSQRLTPAELAQLNETVAASVTPGAQTRDALSGMAKIPESQAEADAQRAAKK